MRSKKLKSGIVAIGMALVGCGVLASSAAAAGPPTTVPDVRGSAPVALAAAGCNSNGPTVTDYRGVVFSTRYCHNYRAGYTTMAGVRNGYLYAGTNWFVCQQRAGENPPVGNARNNIWLYTQGDVAYNSRGWGWFPATHVSGGVNYGPVPGLRWC